MRQNAKVCILDYGSGNVKSVRNLFQSIKAKVVVSNEPEQIQAATHIVLPGVGAFGAAMNKIKARIPLKVVEDSIFRDKKPFLGICVGMQILAEKGFEFGENDGLGWIPGTVEKLQVGSRPLPHIGWNDIQIKKQSGLLEGCEDFRDFYFVHSFAFHEADSDHAMASTEYGTEFTSMVHKDNIYGVQFHPEKSQTAGKLLINNFLNLS